MDHISGAYRSTRESHACLSPFLARVTRSVATRLSRMGDYPSASVRERCGWCGRRADIALRDVTSRLGSQCWGKSAATAALVELDRAERSLVNSARAMTR